MSILSAQSIYARGNELINPFYIENVTSQGYDVTVENIEQLFGYGKLLQEGKQLPNYIPVSQRDNEEKVEFYLPPGQYFLSFVEEVNLPNDVCAFLWSRSSLLRIGASLQTAVWDAGYHGKGASLLLVSNPLGITIEKGARIGQMVFHHLDQTTMLPYEGQYQGGKRV